MRECGTIVLLPCEYKHKKRRGSERAEWPLRPGWGAFGPSTWLWSHAPYWEGKIRFVGLSNVTKEHIELARKIVPIVSVQNRYSFADREWDFVVDLLRKQQHRVYPLESASGRQCRGMALGWIAKNNQRTPMQVALAWLSKRLRSCCPFQGHPRSHISRKICRQLPCN